MTPPSLDDEYQALLAFLLERVLAMLQFGEAKNGALLAFSSAWIVGIVTALSAEQELPLGYMNVCLISLPLFVAAAAIALTALLPKLQTHVFTGAKKGATKNLLFFGDIASLETIEFQQAIRASYGPSRASSASFFQDLEAQISINSKIALRKHRHFNLAGVLTLLAIGLYAVPVMKLAIDIVFCLVTACPK